MRLMLTRETLIGGALRPPGHIFEVPDARSAETYTRSGAAVPVASAPVETAVAAKPTNQATAPRHHSR